MKSILLSFLLFLNLPNLESVIQQRMQEYGATSVGIYYEDPTGKSFTYNPDEIFHAASTMKIPVMMAVFHQVEQGTLKLDQPVTVKNEFISIEDGSKFSLTVEEDSDQEIYKQLGETMTLRALVERMINQSSNLATNIVIEMAQAKKIMELMSQIGAKDMSVLRGVEDLKAYEAGKNNTTSARALGTCLKAILDPKIFSENSRKEMLDILLSQHFAQIAEGIGAKEKGLRVASKNGWITEIHHDAAIVQDSKGNSTILVIMTRGVKEEPQGEKLVVTLASDLWKTFHN